MKKYNFIWILILALIFLIRCKDYLTTYPYGTESLEKLTLDVNGADALLIAAYSNLDGISEQYQGFQSSSNWIFGSVAGGDAYKGSTEGDQAQIIPIETRDGLSADNGSLLSKWSANYNGIARVNDAIRAFRGLENIEDTLRNTRIAEARFLRGFYYFNLYEIFRNIPYFDETVKDVRVGNKDESTYEFKDVLPEIENDFQNASNYLPLRQSDIGRVTKGAAWSFLGICKMWEMDNPDRYFEALNYFDSVINSGRYKLLPGYDENFNIDYDKLSDESILEVQTSVNDGAPLGQNGAYGDILNHPSGGPFSCCGFFQPSLNFVNAFKTDPDTGLPLLYTYNDSDVTNDEGIETSDTSFVPYAGTLDPRLDWTVGRRGIPYLDWGEFAGKDWIRDQADGGPYAPKKYLWYKSQSATAAQTAGWGAPSSAINLKLLRYSDVLLMAAECEVELNNLSQAMDYVNKVRQRAMNGSWVLKNNAFDDPSDNIHVGPSGETEAANYKIGLYTSFPDQDYARRAVQFERRLELGMEGHRFFDLVRWGIADSVMNAYFKAEKKNREYMVNAKFTKGINELFPIPSEAINNSYKNNQPTLYQNPGY